jgi:hypothetical protein
MNSADLVGSTKPFKGKFIMWAEEVKNQKTRKSFSVKG